MTRLVAGPKCRHRVHDDFGVSATNRLLLWSDCRLIEGQKADRRCLVLGGIAEAFPRHGTRPRRWEPLCARDRQPQGGAQKLLATRGLRTRAFLRMCFGDIGPTRKRSRRHTPRPRLLLLPRKLLRGEQTPICGNFDAYGISLSWTASGTARPIVSFREYSTGVGSTASDGHPHRSAAEAGFA